MNRFLYAKGMKAAATLARSPACVEKIRDLCAEQKTISTNKLSGMLDYVDDYHKATAYTIGKLLNVEEPK